MTGRLLGAAIAAGLLVGCASAPPVAPERIYEGRVRLSDGRVTWDCWTAERERARLTFRDLDGDGRWDEGEPGTLERRCEAPDGRSPRSATPAPSRSAPSVHVPSMFTLDESTHLDRFTFESRAGVVVIRDERDRLERVTGVTRLDFYTNAVIVRTRDGEGRIVSADRFLHAEWPSEDEPGG